MDHVLIGKGATPVHLLAKYGNRHGLVAGATGTGKTVSLLVLAEGFSRLGVPVFLTAVNRESAYEMLNARAETRAGRAASAGASPDRTPARRAEPQGPFRTPPTQPTPSSGSRLDEMLWGTKRRQGMVETMAKQAARSVGSQFGRQIFRGILGGMLGPSRRR